MTAEELRNTLSKNIKKYRKGKFTQETLAEAAGMSSQNINDIEGKRRWPREETLVKIADALGVEVFRLFVGDGEVAELLQIEQIPPDELLRRKMNAELVAKVRKSLNRTLDKLEDE